jgi:hypothetical protein
LAQRNYLWNIVLDLERTDPLFETNQTGFLRKEQFRGRQGADFRARYAPQWGLRKIFVGVGGRIAQSLYTDDYFTGWRERNPKLQLSPEFNEDLIDWGASVEAGLEFSESVLDDIGFYYDRSRDVELTDIFTANGFGVFVDTNRSKPISGGISFDVADFYNFSRQSVGLQRQVSIFSTTRPRSNFTIELDGSYAQSLDTERIIDGRFLVGSMRVTYLFTRDLFLRVFAQTGRQRTSFAGIQTDENYLVSVLFGWEYSPKSHIFIAYNEDWNTTDGDLRLGDRVVVFKISYLSNPL